MGQRQLNIRSDEAAVRASTLAKRLGKTTTEVVEEALRAYENRVSPADDRGLTFEQRRRFEALEALSLETSKHLLADAPSNHDWLYDENGLPA